MFVGDLPEFSVSIDFNLELPTCFLYGSRENKIYSEIPACFNKPISISDLRHIDFSEVYRDNF